MDVHAGGQPLLHERTGPGFGALVVWRRRQHDDDLSRAHAQPFSPLVLCRSLLYCLRGVGRDKIGLPSGRKKATRTRPAGRNRRVVIWLVLFIASVFVVDGVVGDRGLLATMRARREYDTAAAMVARQRAENARLREEARRLREDPGAIEEIARRDLGLIRPGEKVFIIKDVPPAKP